MPCPISFIFTPRHTEVLIFQGNYFIMQPFFGKILWLFINKSCKTEFSVELFVYSCLRIPRLIGSYPESTISVQALFRDWSWQAKYEMLEEIALSILKHGQSC